MTLIVPPESYFPWFSGFLELVNNMLTSGMVPALYTDEEKDQIIGTVSRANRLPSRGLVTRDSRFAVQSSGS